MSDTSRPAFEPKPFQPRWVEPAGTLRLCGQALKVYRIASADRLAAGVDWDAFDASEPLIESALPEPDHGAGRPGVGFLIHHAGEGPTGRLDYAVLAWWDRENELPLRIWLDDGDGYRAATGGESVCVWDLGVMAFERDAYVETLLAPRPDREAYLERRFRVG